MLRAFVGLGGGGSCPALANSSLWTGHRECARRLGAHAWDDSRRESFANDLDFDRSLVAVTAATNRSKSDKDPADWMPPASGAHCTYLVDWVAVKAKWELSVDEAEKAALEKAAADCDGEVVERP